jgi:hypothetical protein
MKSIDHGMKRLHLLPMSESQVFIAFCHVQRLCLELLAMVDYAELFIPRMRGSMACATSAEHRMGAFTYDPHIAEQFMRAGLPVWLIRPYTELPHTRIDSVVQVRKPSDYFSLTDATPQFKTFARSTADSSDRYVMFYRHIRNIFSYANPFSFVPPSSSVQPSVSSSSTSAEHSAQSTSTSSERSPMRTTKSKPSRNNQPCNVLNSRKKSTPMLTNLFRSPNDF